MKNNSKNQWIKSVASVICVAVICIAIISSANKISDTIVEKASFTPANNSNSSNVNQSNNSANGTSDNNILTPENNDTIGEIVTDDTTDTSIGNDETIVPDNGNNDSNKTNTPTTSKNANAMPNTKNGIIIYCNEALNKAKAAKVGYNKHYVTKVKGGTTGSIGSLLNVLEKDKTTTMKKGSDLTDDFPAAGYSWSSKLREQDVSQATIKQNGQYYEITLKLGHEVNPAKGEASKYGRVMSVIDANGAKDMVPGIKSVTMEYHDGYVYAKIDSKTGQLKQAEFSASADIAASITLFGDVTAKDIVSTETFTNIQW